MSRQVKYISLVLFLSTVHTFPGQGFLDSGPPRLSVLSGTGKNACMHLLLYWDIHVWRLHPGRTLSQDRPIGPYLYTFTVNKFFIRHYKIIDNLIEENLWCKNNLLLTYPPNITILMLFWTPSQRRHSFLEKIYSLVNLICFMSIIFLYTWIDLYIAKWSWLFRSS